MDTKHLSKLALIAGVFTLFACNETGNEPTISILPEAVVNNFNQMYPNATNISWEQKGEYAVASFSQPQTKAAEHNTKAWFHMTSAEWGMTDTDIPFNMLPQAVLSAFNESEYSKAPWTHDDEADKIQRKNAETLYVIDVEKTENGTETDIDLYYSEDGILVKTVVDAEKDNDYENMLPQTPTSGIDAWLKENYPEARIIDIDKEDGLTEVEIIDNRLVREILFTASGEWLLTKTELQASNVPALVMDALKATEQFAKYPKIDDIDEYITKANGTYYKFELESNYGSTDVYIAADGNVIDKPALPENTPSITVDKVLQDAVEKLYPSAVIVGKEYDDGYLCLEVRHEGYEKEIRFNGKMEWAGSSWDMNWTAVPEIIKNAVNNEFANAKVDDDIEYHHLPANSFYEVEVEQGGKDWVLHISDNGTITKRYED